MAAKNRPFSSDRKPTTCDTALRAGEHHQQRQQHAGQRDAERAARDAGRQLAIGAARLNAKITSSDADQHGGGDVDQRLDVPAHVEAVDHAVQQQRDAGSPSARSVMPAET